MAWACCGTAPAPQPQTPAITQRKSNEMQLGKREKEEEEDAKKHQVVVRVCVSRTCAQHGIGTGTGTPIELHTLLPQTDRRWSRLSFGNLGRRTVTCSSGISPSRAIALSMSAATQCSPSLSAWRPAQQQKSRGGVSVCVRVCKSDSGVLSVSLSLCLCLSLSLSVSICLSLCLSVSLSLSCHDTVPVPASDARGR